MHEEALCFIIKGFIWTKMIIEMKKAIFGEKKLLIHLCNHINKSISYNKSKLSLPAPLTPT